MMQLTEMFNICDSCVYAPCFCGNEPENCIAYVKKTGGVNTFEGAEEFMEKLGELVGAKMDERVSYNA